MQLKIKMHFLVKECYTIYVQNAASQCQKLLVNLHGKSFKAPKMYVELPK